MLNIDDNKERRVNRLKVLQHTIVTLLIPKSCHFAKQFKLKNKQTRNNQHFYLQHKNSQKTSYTF